MSRFRTRAVAVAAVSAALLGPGCVEHAVTESVEISFASSEGAEVTVRTRLAGEAELSGSRSARERAAARREEIRLGVDAWTRQLDGLAPAELRRTVAKTRGEIREQLVTARFEDPEALRRVLEPAPLWISFRREARGSVFEIVPGRDGRASAAERRRVERSLAAFSEAIAAYLADGVSLWRRLDRDPSRARPVLAKLVVPPLLAGGDDAGATTDEEDEVVGRLGARMAAIVEFLAAGEDGEESLDEVAQRVYDPFPAPLAISVPGAASGVEGFVPAGDGRWKVPELSLLGALESLGGRWLAPDPILAALGRRGDGATLEAFLAEPRVASAPPSAEAVNAAIREALKPAPVYRIRF